MSQQERKRFGLIGFGSFGQFAARHLREHFELVVHDAEDRRPEARRCGVAWASLEQAAGCPYVVLAVPLQAFGAVLRAIHDHLEPGALVMDVGSVKVEPLRQMAELLPDDVGILGTHPMFGPQSAGGSLLGRRIVLCPLRTERVAEVRSFLARRLGLEVIVCDADTHDREIADTQALAQFLGRALATFDTSDSAIRTPAYETLLEVAATVGDDSWELFVGIQNLNPYAAAMRERFMSTLDDLQEELAADPSASPRPRGSEAPVPAGAADEPTDRARSAGPGEGRGKRRRAKSDDP